MKSCIRVIIIILLVALMLGSPTVNPVRAEISPANEFKPVRLQETGTS